jgi:hypothetical protein
VTRAEYYRHDSAWRYLRRFPHSHPAEQRSVEHLMARLNSAAAFCVQQDRLVWVLRGYLVQRMVKQVARELVKAALDELALPLKLPDDTGEK